MSSTANDILELHRGQLPLLISLPHDGTAIPDDIAEHMLDSARRVPDTDWHVSTLYDFARELGASLLVPRYSRYVIDLNRPPDGAALYPGRSETGLCPLQGFSGEPLYRSGHHSPDADEVERRRQRYWQPYHAALAGELARIKSAHGRALLWEGHSIRSEVPMLFDGRLPDLNLGTADGASCGALRLQALEALLSAQQHYSWVSNGRFKGGYITRHYGRPHEGVEAIQLELAQSTYMDERSQRYDAVRAGRLQALLRRMLELVVA
ncbi:MAG: N-formylglutamate deformylase [Aquimonas sp.]|nr:N-formylglutamate deformylase [Aquimonas sp.]